MARAAPNWSEASAPPATVSRSWSRPKRGVGLPSAFSVWSKTATMPAPASEPTASPGEPTAKWWPSAAMDLPKASFASAAPGTFVLPWWTETLVVPRWVVGEAAGRGEQPFGVDQHAGAAPVVVADDQLCGVGVGGVTGGDLGAGDGGGGCGGEHDGARDQGSGQCGE